MSRRYRQSLFPILVGILLCLLSLFLFLSKNTVVVNLLHRLEAIPYDMRLKLSIPRKLNDTPPIVIVDIDEASLKTEGRWPWSRRKLAELINRLNQQGSAVIALDIMLAESETNPASTVEGVAKQVKKALPEWFGDIRRTLDADRVFAETIKEKELVLGYIFHRNSGIKHGAIGKSRIKQITPEQVDLFTAIEMKGYTANLNAFNNNAAGAGFFTIIPDLDGAVRHAPLIAVYNHQAYPSLALEAARLYLLEDRIDILSEPIGEVRAITGVKLGKSHIPTDERGQILIPYYGKQKHFHYLSASQVLHSRKVNPLLENAIVLIGTSAFGLADLRPTPVAANFPGVEIQASILHGILHPDTIASTPDWADAATVSWLLLATLLMILIYPLLQPLWLVISGTGLLFASFSFNLWLWASQHIHLPIVLSLLLIMTVSSIFVLHHLFRENKERRRIHSMFGQYVPLEHINKLIETPGEITTEGEKREMSVLFSDIRNFTALSEPLSTRELKDFLNRYLTPITEIIFKNQGTIDKYVGDMVMAFWGAPLKNPKHAEHAVRAALEMQQKISVLQNAFAKMGLPEISAGIGIHSGEMNVGDMGSDFRRAYTVLGDAVNLGSRLEGLTKFYGVKILVSEDVRAQCPDEIVFRYIDYVQVKGKQDAIKIYEPVGFKNQLSERELELLDKHEQALQMYLARQWQAARILLFELLQTNDEKLYRVYQERIEEFSAYKIENWSGVYTHLSK